MSKTVLPQLVKVKAQLTTQVEMLQQALAETQAKRKGLLTVIEMFDGSSGGPAPASKVSITADPIAANRGWDEPDEEAVVDTVPSQAAAKTKSRPRSMATTGPQADNKTKAVKGRGRAGDWQLYIFDAYRDEPLPDVVSGILQANPKTIFKIADIMTLIFQENMPETHYLKARNRVSNILSAGARDGDWYRGRGGTYSLSKKVINY